MPEEEGSAQSAERATSDVVADAEIGDEFVVCCAVRALEITHQTAALTDQFEQTEA